MFGSWTGILRRSLWRLFDSEHRGIEDNQWHVASQYYMSTRLSRSKDRLWRSLIGYPPARLAPQHVVCRCLLWPLLWFPSLYIIACLPLKSSVELDSEGQVLYGMRVYWIFTSTTVPYSMICPRKLAVELYHMDWEWQIYIPGQNLMDQYAKYL